MKELSGDESQILFEGDLTDCDFNGIENIDLTGKIFVCDKAAPYFVFPLQDKYIKPILNQVLPFGLVVHKVTHIQIQIQKSGEIQVMIGDNFHNQCISAGPQVSFDFLTRLKDSGIVRCIQTDEEVKAKYRE